MRQIQTAAFGVPEYEPAWEGTYRPRIQPNQLRALWLLKRKTNRPITELVREAINFKFSERR